MMASVDRLAGRARRAHELGQPDDVLVGGALGLGVAVRHSPTHLVAVDTRRTSMLVLLALMASSMVVSPQAARASNFAGGRSGAARPPSRSSKAPSSSRPAKRPRTSSSPSFTSHLECRAGRPAPATPRGSARSRRAATAPGRIAASAAVQQRLQRPPRPCRRAQAAAVAHLGQLGREVDIDADAQRPVHRPCRRPIALSSRMPATLPPSTSTSFGHFSGPRRPAGRRPCLGHARAPRQSRAAPPRAGGQSGRSSGRDVEIARRRDPGPAAAAAAGGLLAAPRRRCLRARRLGQARGLVVGAAERSCSATSVQPPGRTGAKSSRGTGRRPRPRRRRRAAAGSRRRTAVTRTADATATTRFTPATGRSNAVAGSSKYITLTMRR